MIVYILTSYFLKKLKEFLLLQQFEKTLPSFSNKSFTFCPCKFSVKCDNNLYFFKADMHLRSTEVLVLLLKIFNVYELSYFKQKLTIFHHHESDLSLFLEF